MGCGCGRRGVPRNSRPTIGPRPLRRSSAATPEQLRALGIQTAVSPKEVQRMDEGRRRIEKLRREAVRRSLGR